MLTDKKHPVQYREFRLASVPDVDTRTFSIPVSSEMPVARWWGTEILEHSMDAVDMSRLQDGAPLLLDHDPTRQVGVVESASLQDQRLHATVRFSRSALGEEVMQDVIDGIRRNVSIGYQIQDIEDLGGETFAATRWSPMEISVVSVPADNTVGFGRSDSDGASPLDLLTQKDSLTQKRSPAMSDPIEETPVEETAPVIPAEPTEAPADVEAAVRNAISNERKRAAGIRDTVRMAKLDDALAEKLIDSGKPLDECRAEVLRQWSEKVDASATPSGGTVPEPTQSRAAELAQSILKQVAGV